MGETRFQRPHDLLQHCLRFHKYLVVPEPQNTKSLRLNQAVALPIVPDVLRVLSPIELNDKLRLQTREVSDESRNRHLSPESVTRNLPAPKILPKVSLGIRRLFAQTTCPGL